MVETADPAVEYARMSEQDRATFEQQHFDILPEQDKMRVASLALNSGQTSNHGVAMFLDKAYGNGDGEFNAEDLKLIAEKREDKAFMEGLAKTTEVMAETALASTGLGAWLGAPAQSGLQIRSGGLLSQIFGESAANDETFDDFGSDFLNEILPRNIGTTPGALSQMFGLKAVGGEGSSEQSGIMNAPASGLANEGFDEQRHPPQLQSTAKARSLG